MNIKVSAFTISEKSINTAYNLCNVAFLYALYDTYLYKQRSKHFIKYISFFLLMYSDIQLKRPNADWFDREKYRRRFA